MQMPQYVLLVNGADQFFIWIHVVNLDFGKAPLKALRIIIEISLFCFFALQFILKQVVMETRLKSAVQIHFFLVRRKKELFGFKFFIAIELNAW